MPLGQHPAVGGRDVGVGAEHGRDPAVEVPAHRHLLARHLGVEVDDHGVGLDPVEDPVDGVERRACDLEPDAAAEVDHADPHPAGLDHGVAAARVGLRVVGRPHHALLAVEEVVGLAVAVDVVAGGDDAGAGVEDVAGRALGDPHAAGRVLAVDDDQVGRVLLAQRRHRLAQPAPPGAADDVADEEDPHGADPICEIEPRGGAGATGEIVKRALAYPYPASPRSFVQLGGRSLGAPRRRPRPRRPPPLLAYGANAAPSALARKLAALPEQPLPVLRAELHEFDVVYSAHVSPYGAVPATLRPSPGTAVAVFVAYPDGGAAAGALDDRAELRADEPAPGSPAVPTGDRALPRLDAYLSRHGPLELDGGEVALAAIAARGRALAEMTEAEVLEAVRSRLAPELSLERFVLDCVGRGGLAL